MYGDQLYTNDGCDENTEKKKGNMNKYFVQVWINCITCTNNGGTANNKRNEIIIILIDVYLTYFVITTKTSEHNTHCLNKGVTE